MMRTLGFLILAAALVSTGAAPGRSAEGVPLPSYEWPHAGIFGTIDKAAAQRGFQVYKEVCAGCHGLKLVSFRNLAGIGFSADDVKAVAAGYEVVDGPDDEGDMFTRPGKPADRFPAPYPNLESAQAANGGIVPPDLSVMAKARPGGENYLVALMTGYDDPPDGAEAPPGMHYNHYFPGHYIGMPKMLNDGGVEYVDGTEATELQMAMDVATFLAFTAEPHLDRRKELGVRVLLFLVVFACLMYATKRHLWRNVGH